jgi:hypothetical protein
MRGLSNIQDTSEVTYCDPKILEVKSFSIGGRKHPRVSSTMRKRSACLSLPPAEMVVMDSVSGKVITSMPIGKGVDYAGFDSQAKLIFFSCSEGVLNVFHEKSADEYEDLGPVKTQPSARTMAFDRKTKKIFLSAAEYVETPPATAGGRPGRSIKPGSFVVLVVSKQ